MDPALQVRYVVRYSHSGSVSNILAVLFLLLGVVLFFLSIFEWASQIRPQASIGVGSSAYVLVWFTTSVASCLISCSFFLWSILSVLKNERHIKEP